MAAGHRGARVPGGTDRRPRGAGWWTSALAVAGALLPVAPLAAQQPASQPMRAVRARTDRVQGRVTSDSGAVVGADVIVTMAPTAAVFRTATDSAGRYTLVIPEGTGEYLLYIGALNRRAHRQRLTHAGGDTIFVVDARLAPAVAALATVRVQAQRARPSRSLTADGTLPTGTDGMDVTVAGISGALTADQQGSFDAMAATVPGVAVTPAGTSAFGLGAAANNTTLNGLAFPGADLPRDARTTTRFSTSPWDPTRGGFSGVLVATTLAPGGNISSRSGHVVLDAPALQYADPVARRYGQEFTTMGLSLGGSGALVLDRAFYNYGAQLSRRAADAASLLDADALALGRIGVSADSAARLVQLLGGLGVPVTAGGVPRARTTTTASFTERFDRLTAPATPGGTPGPSWTGTVYARYSGTEASGLSPVASPAFTGRTTALLGAVQGQHARYLRGGTVVNETNAGLTFSGLRGAPYGALPAALVRIASDLPDATGSATRALGSLSFGGNSALERREQRWSAEVVNQTSFFADGKAQLPVMLYVQSRFDGYDQTAGVDRLGTFEYASLADVSLGRPSRFTRALATPRAAGGEWIGAAALGANLTTGQFYWTGGARVDANVFAGRAAYSAEAERRFGVRTDHAPNGIAVSPRLGVHWFYTAPPGARPGRTAFRGTPLSSIYSGESQLRAGVGAFRSLLPATLLADAMTATGLAGGAQQLLCVGDAVPTPDWHAIAADPARTPSACVGGVPAFGDTARTVTAFARGYTAPTSWRASLGWTGRAKIVTLAIDGTYSLNLHQPGTVDLNFRGTPQFALADEGGRPVFVAPAAIVGATGQVSPVHGRVEPGFGRVASRVSDLRAHARQLTISATPELPLPLLRRIGLFTVGYTYADVQAQTRGFDHAAAGDPRHAEWARQSFVPRHQLLLQGGRWWTHFGLTAFVRATSGMPFTPLVGGDVNGDGLANDRAFVFDPATAPDPLVAERVRALLASGAPAARECLRRQLGQTAGRNSCTGPWGVTSTASVVVFPAIPGSRERARVALSVANPLGGVDQLLHGSDGLRGWGTMPYPEQTLLQVRGFDAAARRFAYDVNPRFGSASPTTTAVRTPFRVTLDVSLSLGRPSSHQALEQNLRIKPGAVGTRAPVDSLKRRYLRGFSNIYGGLVRMGDSLALSQEQLARIQRQRPTLEAKADSIYGALAGYLVALPERYDEVQAVKRVTAAGDAMWEAIYAEKVFLRALLTPGQIRRLPGGLLQMVVQDDYRGRFFF